MPRAIPGLTEGQDKPAGAHWLLDARDDRERFRRIEILAGGSSEQMWQIGYRFHHVYEAIVDQNWDLGAYHWTRLGDALNVALMKQPDRTPNAERLFLDVAWPRLDQAFGTKNPVVVREAFLAARAACMACHVAEEKPFLNDAAIFRDTAAFPAR